MSPAALRFLADESCDFAVVRALRAAGHDVDAIAESTPSTADEEVLQRSVSDRRILLTEDKDFGRIVRGCRAWGDPYRRAAMGGSS